MMRECYRGRGVGCVEINAINDKEVLYYRDSFVGAQWGAAGIQYTVDINY